MFSQPQIERRREARFPLMIECRVRIEPSEEWIAGVTQNVSEHGALIEFSAPVPVQLGDSLRCEFALEYVDGQPQPYFGRGMVVRIDGPRIALNLGSDRWRPVGEASAARR